MKQLKLLLIALSLAILTACQVISPVFVDYNGVRMDVAKWINGHQLLSMQQKRSMVQLAKAQQALYRFEQQTVAQQEQIIVDNQVALHCAEPYLSAKQIAQLQDQIFEPQEKAQALHTLQIESAKVKVDLSQARCE